MSLPTLAVHVAGGGDWLGSAGGGDWLGSSRVSHAGKVSVPSGGCSWNRISLSSLACGGLRAPPYSVWIWVYH